MNQKIKTAIVDGINELLNNKVLLITAILGLSIYALIGTGFQSVGAVEFSQYGQIGQEDQLVVRDNNGLYWINTGTAYGVGNGQFELFNEINDNFSINGAIKVFGINEDTESFIYEPQFSNGKFSNVLFLYEIVEPNHFKLNAVYEDESGIDQEVTQLENNI